jgi:hypothetical protein
MLHQEAVLAVYRQEVLRLDVPQHLLQLTLQGCWVCVWGGGSNGVGGG